MLKATRLIKTTFIKFGNQINNKEINMEEWKLLNSVVDGGEWAVSRPGRFTSGERVPCYARWVEEPVWMIQRR
jgi:hypothetical protein